MQPPREDGPAGMELRQMFGWFKRASKAPPARPAAPRRSTGAPAVPAKKEAGARPPAPFLPSGPAALPEVVGEGNTEAEWSQWEDSMMALDSQMQDLMPSHRVYVRDTQPSKLDEIPDAFSSVRGKRDR